MLLDLRERVRGVDELPSFGDASVGEPQHEAVLVLVRIAGGGEAAASEDDRHTRIAWFAGCVPILGVGDQLLDVIHAHLRMPREEASDRAGSLLDLVGIPRSRLRSYPHELSGGMRQRVMIAMALATDPEVVIMDEPTTALDVVVQRDILAQIVELKEQLGFSIVFITHDLSLLLELADRIAVMYAGQLLEIGTAGEIHREPSHPRIERPRNAAM